MTHRSYLMHLWYARSRIEWKRNTLTNEKLEKITYQSKSKDYLVYSIWIESVHKIDVRSMKKWARSRWETRERAAGIKAINAHHKHTLPFKMSWQLFRLNMNILQFSWTSNWASIFRIKLKCCACVFKRFICMHSYTSTSTSIINSWINQKSTYHRICTWTLNEFEYFEMME